MRVRASTICAASRWWNFVRPSTARLSIVLSWWLTLQTWFLALLSTNWWWILLFNMSTVYSPVIYQSSASNPPCAQSITLDFAWDAIFPHAGHFVRAFSGRRTTDTRTTKRSRANQLSDSAAPMMSGQRYLKGLPDGRGRRHDALKHLCECEVTYEVLSLEITNPTYPYFWLSFINRSGPVTELARDKKSKNQTKRICEFWIGAGANSTVGRDVMKWGVDRW